MTVDEIRRMTPEERIGLSIGVQTEEFGKAFAPGCVIALADPRRRDSVLVMVAGPKSERLDQMTVISARMRSAGYVWCKEDSIRRETAICLAYRAEGDIERGDAEVVTAILRELRFEMADADAFKAAMNSMWE